jgi:2-polyprenyl-3-methyl-5-hydroxy-6-metoxy-1,4-benzoquinol methylase
LFSEPHGSEGKGFGDTNPAAVNISKHSCKGVIPMDQAKREALKLTIERLENSIITLREIIGINFPSKVAVPQKQHVVKSKKNVASSLPANFLSPTPDHKDENWPQAMHPHLILTDKGDVEKQFRALQIANLIRQFGIDIEDQRILDVGCGEGHITAQLAIWAKDVIGYDISSSFNWDNRQIADFFGTVNFSSNPAFVENQDSFDVVILFDVLDHIIRMEPTSLLQWCADRLSEDGKIFIRFHPWSSRHGGHIYDKLNKAFAHLVYTSDELAKLGIIITEPGAKTNQKIIKPLATYEKWIKNSGLVSVNRKLNVTKIEPYVEKLLPRINEVSWAGRGDLEKILKIIKIDSVDYILAKNGK